MTLEEVRSREHYSFSSINQFFNICALQWYFQRIVGIKPAFTPASLSFGSSFHRTMEFIAAKRMEGIVPKAQETEDLFQTLWERQVEEDGNVQFDEDTTKDSLGAVGRNMARCAVAGVDPEEEVIDINRVFTVPIIAGGESLQTPMVGELDCVVRKGDKTTVVDWKTSCRKWPAGKAAKELQPTVFLNAYWQLTGTMPDFRYEVITKAKSPVLECHTTTRTTDDFARLGRLVALMSDMVKHEHYAPSEQSFYCSGCPFKAECRKWHKTKTKVITTSK